MIDNQKANDRFAIFTRAMHFIALGTLLFFYARYMSSILQFPYDWEPTDGDHLNFAHRIASGLPIYFSLKSAKILNIYNPLYHTILAIVGGAHASLILARSLSFLYWLIIPFILFFSYAKRWGYFYAFTAATFVFLPTAQGILLDIVHVSPNSLMACLFCCSLIYADYCFVNKKIYFVHWVAIGALAAGCFMAKQQGIIAIASIGLYAITKRVPFRCFLYLLIGFSLIFLPMLIYFEIANSGQFLKATLFELNHIMVVTPDLARSRLLHFLSDRNFFFSLCVVVSFGFTLYREIPWSIWHMSFVLHILLLLATLGNAGGGENYLVTFWITIVMISIGLIKACDNPSLTLGQLLPIRYAPLSSFSLQKVGSCLFAGLLVSFSTGVIPTVKELQLIHLPNLNMVHLMQDYYQSIDKLLVKNPHANILVYRNIGALVRHDVNIENEGSSMFNYGFAHPDIFDTNSVIQAIRYKKYDFISTGIQPYPKVIQSEIDTYYQKVLSGRVNLNLGTTGAVSIYAPKTI